jgi:hypothetical protein
LTISASRLRSACFLLDQTSAVTLKEEITRVHADNYGVSGARMVWLALTAKESRSNAAQSNN